MNINEFSNFILYEDNHLLVVCKPAGILSQGDNTIRANMLDLAKHYLKTKYQKSGEAYLGLVHRLDSSVGGVLVFAKTSKSARRLSEQFRNRSTRKIYLAAVEGVPHKYEGSIETYLIQRGAKTEIVPQGELGARLGCMCYKTIKTYSEFSVLEVDLFTGYRHQIRVQLASIGCPIAGDRLYGAVSSSEKGAIGLFARSLTIKHPTKHNEITFEAVPSNIKWFKDY